MPATAVSEPAGDTSGSARLILVGRVTGPYGVRGWVKIEPFTELPESLLEYRAHWRMGRDEPGPRWKPVFVNEAALHSGNVIALIDDCPHRESALQLKGMGIAVPRTMLPQAGEGVPGGEAHYRRILFEWAYPQVAEWCRRQGRPYPALTAEGEIAEELPRTLKLRY